MEREHLELLDGRARLFRLPQFDEMRGTLAPLDFSTFGFEPVRMLWVSAPMGATRGGHSHRRGPQLLFAMPGPVSIELRWQGRAE